MEIFRHKNKAFICSLINKLIKIELFSKREYNYKEKITQLRIAG